ncbi:MAG: hypothetical protein Q7R50_05125 [Dehalococcoidales bacterium]|nr:hypothetical protein [Dehalococcoidales bacterium]
MRLNFVKSIGVVLGTVVLLIAPTVCAASMDITMDAQSAGPCPQGGGIERRFTASSGSLSHCVLIRAMGEQAKPESLISYDMCLSWCLENSTSIEPSQVQATSFQREIIKIPLSAPPEHHCRNFLSSEEPPL